MTPEEYDAWYRAPRGRWIGETEYRLLCEMLAPAPGASVLDVGCGSGYFTRRLAADGFEVTGIDVSPETIRYAQSQAVAGERYMVGDARRLPFPDRHFDACVAITSLCFIREQEQALAEIVRVTRRRIVLGLLNRHSLLCWQKGRHGGRGAYRGARWHTARAARALLVRANLQNIVIRSAIYLPSGNGVARTMENVVPQGLLCGGFLLVAGDIT
jgi:ubiquinone/menaquinone biosynthesis C-methylase UbiE